jgi:enoyl-CoA hydratase
MTFRYVTYEPEPDGRIVRITLDRPQTRNAQSRGLLVELDEAFAQAEQDDEVRVVVLAGAGALFSAGHDLGSSADLAERASGEGQHPTYAMNGAGRSGPEGSMLQEWHYYFTNTLRWRNLRKITVAEVHGPVFAAGLMLMWCCDLIVASEETVFADVVGARFGMCGVEYFAHPWEFGPRKTKELMLTGDSMSAVEAHQLGMVSKIFPRETLTADTMTLARRIASLPSMTALLIKESVNQTVDNMGFYNSLQACFTLHQLNHAHWSSVHEDGFASGRPSDGLPEWKDAPAVRPSKASQP